MRRLVVEVQFFVACDAKEEKTRPRGSINCNDILLLFTILKERNLGLDL